MTVMVGRRRDEAVDPQLDAVRVRRELEAWAASLVDTADQVSGLVDRLRVQVAGGQDERVRRRQ